MKAFLIAIGFAAIGLAGCAKAPERPTPSLVGVWESETPPTIRMTVDSNSVTFHEVQPCCSLDGRRFTYNELGPNHFAINYRWIDPRLNLEISAFDVVVKENELQTRCIYEKLRKNDANNYPMMIDESAPCIFRSFRRVQ